MYTFEIKCVMFCSVLSYAPGYFQFSVHTQRGYLYKYYTDTYTTYS